MRNTVLDIGGAGYVSSHASKALARAGYTPVAYDSLVKGHESTARQGPLARGDISHADTRREVVKPHSPVAVLHFAGYAYVGESVLDPAQYYRNTIVATLMHLLRRRDDAADARDVRRRHLWNYS
jgi:UDP-arabinose 4-epimerase